MADLAREIGSRIRTQAVPGRDVAWVDTLDPLTVTLHGTTQPATNLSGQRLAVGDRVLVQRAGGSMIITHLHETRPQSGVVVDVTPGGEAVVEAGGREIEHVPVVDSGSESVAELGRKPASATGLSVSTWAYTDTDGANRGAVSVSWDPVVDGTDSEPVVVDHYKIATQHGTGPWGVVVQTPLTEGEILNLDPGTDLGVTVHAVSEAGVAGPAPAHVRIVVAEDTTPPPVPETPVGVSAMGTVTWTLSGEGAGGVPMPADYQHTILTCTGVRDGTTVVSTHTVSGRGTVVAGPYDRATTATASAVSVDRSGNESDDSPTATVAVKSVMDDSPLTGWRDELEEALETLDTDVLEVRNDLIPPLEQAITKAQLSANRRNQVIHNLLPPFGEVHPDTGEPLTPGDVWWQVDTLGPGRVTLGQWGWDGTGWRSTTIGHEVINSVDVNDLNVYGTAQIRTGVIEKLWVDGIAGIVAAFQEVVIGGRDNLVPDPEFADDGLRSTRSSITENGITWDTNPDRPDATHAGRLYHTGARQNFRFRTSAPPGGEWQVTPGQQYQLSVYHRGHAETRWRFTMDLTFADGSTGYHAIGGWKTPSYTTAIATESWTVPPTVVRASLAVQRSAPGEGGATDTSGQWVRFERPVMRPLADAVRIANGAVDAEKLRANIAMANFFAGIFAEFDTAFIGKLEADAIRSGSWIGQLLAGVNVKISDDPDDPLAEHIMLANLAMRIMRGDGDGGLYEATSLGGAGLDQLSMRPSASGSPRVVISGDGNASFAGHASVGTLAVGGELLSERLARLPQGIMADFPASGAAIRSWGNTNYGLVRLSWQAQAGRRYKLSMKLNLQGTEGDSYWLTIRTARGSTQPTVNSAIFAQDYGTIAPNAAVGSTNHDTHEHEFTIMDTYNGTFNALVVIRTWNANREMQLRSGADYASRFTLEDMGFVDGAAVVVDPAGGNPFTGTAPAPAPQPTPRKQTLYRSNWRSFRNGSTYSRASELEHGTYDGIVRRSQLLFPAIPSGATNIRAKLRIRATHTWAGSGATFYIGIGTESSLQTSIPGHSAGAQHHFARGEEKEIPLPGWTTSHRSVWLGIGAPGTNAAYGRLDPSSAYIVYDYDLA